MDRPEAEGDLCVGREGKQDEGGGAPSVWLDVGQTGK
jgi:hypothetical protein